MSSDPPVENDDQAPTLANAPRPEPPLEANSTLGGRATFARARVPPAAVSRPAEVNVEPTSLAEQGIAARYETRALLGEGGMGQVHLCKDHRIGREVAMKVVRVGHGSRSDARTRFEREARVQGQLEHPSVVPVYDLGIGADGAAFFTMKRVRGLTLAKIFTGLRNGDPAITQVYSRRKLLTAFTSVCMAVAFAHSRGVLHRDLKPDNVMLGDFGEVHLLDWGLAKLINTADVPAEPWSEPSIDARSTGERHTAIGEILGTPGYMAPEQARGEVESLDERIDVYALGAILFELLALEPLHGRLRPVAILASTLLGADARASVRAPGRDVPPELEAICVRATMVDKNGRFATVREMSDAIERFLDGDRDLERRREMAEAHAAAAAAAVEIVAAGGEDALRARANAMREAGAALALDPSHAGAMVTIERLLEIPATMSADAQREFHESRRPAERAYRRAMFFAYIGILSFAPVVLTLGILDWLWYTIGTALMAASAILGWWSWRHEMDRRIAFLVYVVGSISIMFSGKLMGWSILVPGIAATHTLGFFIFGSRRMRIPALVLGTMTVIIPFALHSLGWVTPAYVFEGGVMRVVPRMANFPPGLTLMFLLVANLTMIVAPAAVMSRFRDALSAAEKRIFLHAYNLRQLVPDQARSAASVPPAEPAAEGRSAISGRQLGRQK